MSQSYPSEPYEAEVVEEQLYYEPEPPKKGMSGWLIALIVILVILVVCCLCTCLALILMGPAVGNVFSGIVETMEVPIY